MNEVDRRDITEEKMRAALTRKPRCPTTWKAVFKSEDNATEAAASLSERHGVQFEAYRCPCTRWHIRDAEKARNNQDRIARKRERKAAERGERPRSFLEWEDNLIMNPDVPLQELVLALKRSPNAIRTRRRRLRMSKP
jgi:hypothetical protein